MRRWWMLVWVAAMLASVVSVQGVSAQGASPRRAAEPAAVQLSLSPLEGAGAGRYRHVLELRPAAGDPLEVVADRRLLMLTVRPEGSRRRYRCRHPLAPRGVDEGRVRTLRAGATDGGWREWIDLRMYCAGRARRALEGAATVEVAYGFRARGRGRWIARASGDGANLAWRVEAEELLLSAPSEPSEAAGAPEGDVPAVSVGLHPADVRQGGALSFRVTLRATGAPARVYLRDDLLSFVVAGPLGTVRCEPRRQPIVPIIDFYRRLRGRAAATTSVAAARMCPAGTFELAGVYEVTPVVDLIYGGERYDLEVVTGTFEGEPVPIRVRSGERGYVEQLPEDLAQDPGPEPAS